MNILCLLFLRDIHERHLSLKDVDVEQSNFATKIKNLDKGNKKIAKRVFLNNLGLLMQGKLFLVILKADYFQ